MYGRRAADGGISPEMAGRLVVLNATATVPCQGCNFKASIISRQFLASSKPPSRLPQYSRQHPARHPGEKWRNEVLQLRPDVSSRSVLAAEYVPLPQ